MDDYNLISHTKQKQTGALQYWANIIFFGCKRIMNGPLVPFIVLIGLISLFIF